MSSVSAINSSVSVTNESAVKSGANSSGTDFSSILAETLEQQLTENIISMTAGSGGQSALSSLSYGTGGLESLIMTAAASGEADDTTIALLMLCMMMEGSQDTDYSPLMSLMAVMLKALSSEDTETLYNNVMQSDYSSDTLSAIDSEVFGTKSTGTPAVTGTGKAIVPTAAGKPTTPAVTSDETDRSASKLREVISQFNVETAERYEPFRNGKTYCNIFVWDVTSAMGCEIPHYVDPSTGEPRTYPDVKGAKELSASGIEDWLVKYGPEYGWREVGAEEAQGYANAGKAAVTTAGSLEHVQVVCPSESGGYDALRGVSVAQAGSKVYNYTYLSNIYSAGRQSSIRYFVHE